MPVDACSFRFSTFGMISSLYAGVDSGVSPVRLFVPLSRGHRRSVTVSASLPGGRGRRVTFRQDRSPCRLRTRVRHGPGKKKSKQPKLPEPARRSIRRRYAEGEFRPCA